MKHDKTLKQLLAEIDEQVAWFHGDAFELEQAAERFASLKELIAHAERQLQSLQHEIEVLDEAA